MDLTELGRNTFSFWWPGAALFIVLLLYFLIAPQKTTTGNRRQLLTQTSVAFLAYSILCLAIALSKRHFFSTSHFMALALAMLAASSFLVGLYFEKAKPLMKAAGLMLLVTAASASYGNWFPQNEGGFPTKEVKLDVYNMRPLQLADEGEKIIFGEIGQSKIQGTIGRGQCPLCHLFHRDMLSERAPNLWGITDRAHERLKDPRYHQDSPLERDTVEKEAYPGSGTATNPLEYIAESLVCPSCYVVAGYGVRWTNDTESPGVKLHRPPISLSVSDFIAVTTWLYIHDGKKPPAPEEIETAYRKFIPPSEWSSVSMQDPNPPPSSLDIPLATGKEPVDLIFNRAQCIACHVIPGIPGAIGTLGPKLTMKSVAPARLRDTAYRGKAKTAREYVTESILDPSAYVVKNFPDNIMPMVYGTKLTGLAIDKMVNYLSQIEEGKVPPRIN